MGRRRRARELAVQVLFHLEYNPGDFKEAFELVCSALRAPRQAKEFAGRLVEGVCLHREELDRMIREASLNWRLERMTRVDRNILRLAVFEIIFLEDIPPSVSIDEAVELGKLYGSTDSGAFINGVLDRIVNAAGEGSE